MNKLIIADSEKDPDMLYATRFFAPDPFIFIQKGQKKHMVVSSLELGRARSETKDISIIPASNFFDKLTKMKGSEHWLSKLTLIILKEMKIKKIQVPSSFPSNHYAFLRKKGITIDIKDDIFPQRKIKTDEEIKNIIQVQRATEKAMKLAKDIISKSKIFKKGVKKAPLLKYKGKILTSEFIKLNIKQSLLSNGCTANNTIVSSGIHTAYPHMEGTGNIIANSPIIIDIFPRSEKNGYFADMTRTFCKGNASDELLRLYRTVKKGQLKGISMVKDGVSGKTIHNAIEKIFDRANYTTDDMHGFIHSTGHGLGLEIHEEPRVSKNALKLKAGNIVTVEPGLYYPDIGGVRIEDLIVVQKNKSKNLTRFPKELEL